MVINPSPQVNIIIWQEDWGPVFHGWNSLHRQAWCEGDCLRPEDHEDALPILKVAIGGVW